LVGLVVFIILIIIQFIVITKGAERVSEVAASFTLDAMPGKQMSIDADLNAGMVTEQEAKVRREKVAREADFYGAMDGASKFVKGDAIAGIIIVLINVLFGIVIGMLQKQMSIQEAASHFTLLSVGDGIVSQLPALLISTATGIVVTRAASDGNLGHDITGQLFAYPKLLYVTAGTILLLGIFTPIGILLTGPLALLLAIGGYALSKAGEEKEKVEDILEEEAEVDELKSPESVVHLLDIDPIEFEFGYGLIPLADANQGGDLLDRIVMISVSLRLNSVSSFRSSESGITSLFSRTSTGSKLKETKSQKASFSSITFWRCLRQAKTIRSKELTRSNRPSASRQNGYRNLRKIRPKCSDIRLSIRLQSCRPTLQSR
jgi:flagellar biosynthesis protein FlhA